MAEYTITLTGDELDELQDIVADIKTEQPASTVTDLSYVQQLVSGFLRDRVTSAYIEHVKAKSLAELQSIFGDRKAVKARG